MTVTNPGGDGNAGLCTVCTADAQCDGATDDCIRLGTSGDYFCGSACTSDTQCPSMYYCSLTSLRSIDGDMARQCIPSSYSCGSSTTTSCTDDSHEANDTIAAASAQASLADGTTSSLVSCPDASGAGGNNDDFYRIDLAGDTELTIALTGDGKNDLDLALDDANGNVLTRQETLSSDETITTCLGAGSYYARVYAYASGESSYSLAITRTAKSCTQTCTDDALEDNDDASQATVVDVSTPYTVSGQICAGDDDWFAVYLFAGDNLHVALGFTQTTDTQDLDIHVYGTDGVTDLTPCTEADPSTCNSANGQSADSNENYTGVAPADGTYYVVIRGWNRSENSYDLCIGLLDGDCPVY
jgi:hypothetical protein